MENGQNWDGGMAVRGDESWDVVWGEGRAGIIPRGMKNGSKALASTPEKTMHMPLVMVKRNLYGVKPLWCVTWTRETFMLWSHAEPKVQVMDG